MARKPGQPEPAVGQVWRDNDPRTKTDWKGNDLPPRTVKLTEVGPCYIKGISSRTGRPTRILQSKLGDGTMTGFSYMEG